MQSNLLEEIKQKEQVFMARFGFMPTGLELDVESYAELRDILLVDPTEEFSILWDSYNLLVNEYQEGRRVNFILSDEL